ncbi:hypothetical protein KIW84_042649 [Lathyrus oleraceus]|nr:hypothetical protein KIW84_042649 [Pisum sativum]
MSIPWDVDTEGLKEYMSKFGELEDCFVIKDRSSGRSRGFGYVTFTSVDDAKKVLSSEHSLGNRMLEVKVATPKEEMRALVKKVARIFVGRIAPSVTEATFRSHFEKYGDITDLYMPKDLGSKTHRGIGFITFASADSVENLMKETHELGGSDVVIDQATPKEDDFKPIGRTRTSQGGHSAYNNAYISAPTRYAALAAPTMYDRPSSIYGRREPVRGMSKKIFVGRLPQEATTQDLRLYFERFGHILDVYIPRHVKKSGHRGFGFVTFADYGVADCVSRRSHEICGRQVVIGSPAPLDDTGPSGNSMVNNSMYSYRRYGAPVRPYFDRSSGRPYVRMYDNRDFDNRGYGVASRRPSRADWRYRPY